MDVEATKSRLLEYIDAAERYRLCSPSDDAEALYHCVQGYRHLLQKIQRAGNRVIEDSQTRSDLIGIPLPDDIYDVFNANSTVSALIPEIRDELNAATKVGAASVASSTIQIFISHANAQKEIAGAVREEYQRLGLSAFIAHEDIKVSDEWKNEILAALEECNVFVFLLSEEFEASDWCSQEIGVAFARKDVLFIPISLDGTKPYGFVSHVQSQPAMSGKVPVELLIEPLLRRLPRLVIPSIIVSLEESESFDASDSLIEPLVQHFDKFTPKEAESFAKSAN
jgi:hypothetical protein